MIPLGAEPRATLLSEQVVGCPAHAAVVAPEGELRAGVGRVACDRSGQMRPDSQQEAVTVFVNGVDQERRAGGEIAVQQQVGESVAHHAVIDEQFAFRPPRPWPRAGIGRARHEAA
jgi:hypothetical protein